VRTNIEIDDELMAKAMELTGLGTKKAVVDEALRQLVVRKLRDRLFFELPAEGNWEGDLDEMRTGRFGEVWPYVGEGVMSVAEDSEPYDGADAKRTPA